MAFDIELRSPAPPDRVLAAIRESLREWRESTIPRELWDHGVLQVVGDVKPPRFRMRFDRRWNWGEGGDLLVLAGEVLPDAGSGSRIVARCGQPSYVRWPATFFGLMVLWSVVRSGGIPWSLVFVAALIIAIGAWNDRKVSRAQPDAAYLAQRLEEAVGSAAATELAR